MSARQDAKMRAAVKRAELRHSIVAEFLHGNSVDDIAKEHGITAAKVKTAILAHLRKRGKDMDDHTGHLRVMMYDRLQDLVKEWWEAAKGDDKAVDKVLKMTEMQIRLYGVNAPEQMNLTHAIPQSIELVVPDVPVDDLPPTMGYTAVEMDGTVTSDKMREGAEDR